jgi:hypothetical protein
MKRFLAFLVLLLSALTASAQQPGRLLSQPELDALVAPIALYPDSVVSQVLVASTYPQDVAHAAAWSRANPHLSGDDAVHAAAPNGWHPAVTGLVAFPDLLARMEESPQWVADLGHAYLAQEPPHVMATVQQLRARAHAGGHLRSDGQQQVYSSAGRIVVQPVYPQYVVLPYYNPLVVFGHWHSAHYRPVYWRPWHARPVTYRWHAPQHWSVHRHVHRQTVVGPYVKVPEAHRRPIVESARIEHRSMPAAAGFTHQQQRARDHGEHRGRGHGPRHSSGKEGHRHR